jgi:FkbM family methyltransferase
LAAAGITGNDIRDIADFTNVNSHFVSVEWGIYLALFGSTNLVLASVLLFVETGPSQAAAPFLRRRLASDDTEPHRAVVVDSRGRIPMLGGIALDWASRSRTRRAKMARMAAEVSKQTIVEATANERMFRKEFAELAGRVTPYIAVEEGGLIYFLPTRQKFGIGRFAKSDWKEHRHLERALAILNDLGVELPGTAFVDIGANIGTTTVPAIAKFGFTTGYAFEPEPENFRLLRINLTANGVRDAVETCNLAVSNRTGTGELALRPTSGGKHHLIGHWHFGEETRHVSLTTLDELVAGGRLEAESVGLLWLDIQGHEFEALEGGRTLLGRAIPIVMELDQRQIGRAQIHALRDLLGEQYTSVVDLSRTRGKPDAQPLSALEQIADRHEGTYTDVLIFRSPF